MKRILNIVPGLSLLFSNNQILIKLAKMTTLAKRYFQSVNKNEDIIKNDNLPALLSKSKVSNWYLVTNVVKNDSC